MGFLVNSYGDWSNNFDPYEQMFSEISKRGYVESQSLIWKWYRYSKHLETTRNIAVHDAMRAIFEDFESSFFPSVLNDYVSLDFEKLSNTLTTMVASSHNLVRRNFRNFYYELFTTANFFSENNFRNFVKFTLLCNLTLGYQGLPAHGYPFEIYKKLICMRNSALHPSRKQVFIELWSRSHGEYIIPLLVEGLRSNSYNDSINSYPYYDHFILAFHLVVEVISYHNDLNQLSLINDDLGNLQDLQMINSLFDAPGISEVISSTYPKVLDLYFNDIRVITDTRRNEYNIEDCIELLSASQYFIENYIYAYPSIITTITTGFNDNNTPILTEVTGRYFAKIESD
jgi:hypothetical protein